MYINMLHKAILWDFVTCVVIKNKCHVVIIIALLNLYCIYWLSLSLVYIRCLPSLGADQSIKLVKNYTVFQNDTPAMFYCYGNGYENGALVGWILNGTGYGSKHAQRGIRVVTDTPIGDTVSSRLFIPSNYTINNGTEVKCTTIDSTSYTLIVTSEPASLTLQGECCNINMYTEYIPCNWAGLLTMYYP